MGFWAEVRFVQLTRVRNPAAARREIMGVFMTLHLVYVARGVDRSENLWLFSGCFFSVRVFAIAFLF